MSSVYLRAVPGDFGTALGIDFSGSDSQIEGLVRFDAAPIGLRNDPTRHQVRYRFASWWILRRMAKTRLRRRARAQLQRVRAWIHGQIGDSNRALDG